MAISRLYAACAAGLFVVCNNAGADPHGVPAVLYSGYADLSVPKAASAQTLGARATVTPSATLFGGFEVTSAANVYILVRGNSLGSLGITQNFLDFPRVRVFNSAGADIAFEGATPGFAGCSTSNSGEAAIRSYYAAIGIPASDFDACVSGSLSAGAYTFTVTPSTSSVPSSGQVLFEVKLNP